ncbi:DUF5659 domain-containing protein [Aquibacillus saliphilus]|uniref:DUF5659 domain-containing protein n=1 Tax=Aquibacillus saliphilus TaxID=1909422 RepID=UPI001CEFD690|nr:DUF5659 domain-containing protein [Aquibacillus saliphilus]
MQKDYIVFSQSLAGYLMMNHHVLRKLKQTNKPNSNRNIFIFNESPELLNLVEQYKTTK